MPTTNKGYYRVDLSVSRFECQGRSDVRRWSVDAEVVLGVSVKLFELIVIGACVSVTVAETS